MSAGLAEKMIAIQKSMTGIEKRQSKNGLGYDYHSAEDVKADSNEQLINIE